MFHKNNLIIPDIPIATIRIWLRHNRILVWRDSDKCFSLFNHISFLEPSERIRRYNRLRQCIDLLLQIGCCAEHNNQHNSEYAADYRRAEPCGNTFLQKRMENGFLFCGSSFALRISQFYSLSLGRLYLLLLYYKLALENFFQFPDFFCFRRPKTRFPMRNFAA